MPVVRVLSSSLAGKQQAAVDLECAGGIGDKQCRLSCRILDGATVARHGSIGGDKLFSSEHSPRSIRAD